MRVAFFSLIGMLAVNALALPTGLAHLHRRQNPLEAVSNMVRTGGGGPGGSGGGGIPWGGLLMAASAVPFAINGLKAGGDGLNAVGNVMYVNGRDGEDLEDPASRNRKSDRQLMAEARVRDGGLYQFAHVSLGSGDI